VIDRISRSLLLIGCWLFILASIQAQDKGAKSIAKNVAVGDTLSTQTFVSESELSLFIAEELKINESVLALNQQEVDSLHQVLNQTKQLLIPRADLVKFLGFSVAVPETKLVMSQEVELSPKSRVLRLELDAIQGDSFTLTYSVESDLGNAAKVEIVLNKITVAKESSSKRGKKINLAFVASETGTVEIVLRSLGPFKEKGLIEVYATPRAEHIEVKKIRTIKVRKELVDAQVQDTIFQTVADERVILTNRANLKGSAVLQKQLDFGSENEVLGFALFYFPYIDKDNLQISRREIYREDPLEDFSAKELSGKSFTYLPEFSFAGLAVTVTDAQRRLFWSNGNNSKMEDWKVSPNSKANYAFFQSQNTQGNGTVQVRFSNTSDLYDLDFGLKIITLTLKKFTVKQEVDVEEFEETILLTLL
jgi:hypothetical protein